MIGARSAGVWLIAVASAAGLACGSRQREDAEEAFRMNNRGVALLEQFAFDEAADAFRSALESKPDLRLAHINLPIALFYANRTAEAGEAAAAAKDRFPDAPQPLYLLGLIARGENRLDEAADAFRGVLALDRDDVGAQVNLALVYLQQGRYDEAAALCRSALAVEPYNGTAAYNLALALTRRGDATAGAQAMQRFEQLRATSYLVTYSQTYLSQGRYAEGVASTGIEPELVDRDPPPVSFTDATASLIDGARSAPVTTQPTDAAATAVALVDLDNDGDLDLLAGRSGVQLFRNDGARMVEITGASGLAGVPGMVGGILAGDYNNDTRADLLLLTSGGPRLFAQGSDGRFAEAPLGPLPPGAAGRTAAFADTDHDGDLDVLISHGADASLRLLRNNGNGTFTDITKGSGVEGVSAAVGLVVTDFDNRRDVDLIAAAPGLRPALLQNRRDGSFADIAGLVGFPGASTFASIAAGDVNNDGFTDLFFGISAAPGRWAMSDGRGRYQVIDASSQSSSAIAAQVLDYDNDGLADLVTLSADGPRLFRNRGADWADSTDRALAAGIRAEAGARTLAAGDLDLDGDADIVAGLADGGFRIWRNEGGNRNASLRVALSARVSNRSSLGAKIEVRAGSGYQKFETAATTPATARADVAFGLGRRRAADVVRVLWPSGILQAEPAPPGTAAAVFTIRELDRKPSSCPYLFAWNGTSFEFVTDFLGGGEMGYWEGPGKRNTPDPVEYVRISADQLRARDGRYELRVTNELEEALFADRLQLMAVAHPRGINVYPNEGLTEPPKPFRLHAVTNETSPVRAYDEHGHDVGELIARLDWRYPDDFDRAPLRGYAREHHLTLDLGQPRASTVLLLTGWTDYAFSSDNVAAHQAGLALTPPIVQVKDARGRWRTVADDVGVPVGRPQTIVVDLGRRLRPGEHEVRIVTSMRIYWDQVLVADAAPAPDVRVVTLDPTAATLQYRGFSAERRPDAAGVIVPDYRQVSVDSPWKPMAGRYTREGDVLPLVTRTDDMFVVARAGDEIAMTFAADAAGTLPEGWTHTFLLAADGFSKEMDINSASPDTVEPLPFHGMTRYPYRAPEQYPDTPAHRAYVDAYNTRVVSAAMPTLTKPGDVRRQK